MKISICKLVFLLAVFSFSNAEIRAQALLPNASAKLQIPTYDGSFQAIHPTVIDFLNEYGKLQWNGYRYWMSMTPYTWSDNSVENPSLVASNNGINWVVPAGITNPLIAAKGSAFNSDPDMVYNPATNELWIYYRYENGPAQIDGIKLIIVDSTLHCSIPQMVLENTLFNPDSIIVSPCVWRASDTDWHMWGVQYSTSNSSVKLVYAYSVDGIQWSKVVGCSDINGLDPFSTKGYRPWHPCCKPNYSEGRIEFLVASSDTQNISQSPWKTDMLVYAECPMYDPVQISLPISNPIIKCPNGAGWDNQVIYRASFQIIDSSGCYFYKVWYSGRTYGSNWGSGYTKGYIGTTHLTTSCENLKNDNDISINYDFLNSRVMISLKNSSGAYNASIYDMSGKLLRTSEINDEQTSIDISSFRNSAYIVRVRGNRKVNSSVIVKM